MNDLNKVALDKERIVSIIRNQGPAYPAKIAREINMNPIFISAFLAELVSEKRLRMTHMKIGSSPIYYLPEQIQTLENFSNYLSSREKEAFFLLKDKLLLEDQALDPPVRVAMRSIKDFATPVNVKVGEETKFFWKYHLKEEDVQNKIKELISPQLPPKPKIEAKPKETIIVEKAEVKSEEIEVKEKPVKKPASEDTNFVSGIKDYLSSKDIEVTEEILKKKKEFIAKIRLDTHFGKQELYLIAKEKKKISSDDLAIALQKATAEKMPAITFSNGELDKTAKEYLSTWSNLIKFEKIKL